MGIPVLTVTSDASDAWRAELPSVTAETAWSPDAYCSAPWPPWELTRWERRYVELLTSQGLDGFSAWLVVLDYRLHERGSPWFWLIEPYTEQVRQEWIRFNNR